MPPEWAPHKATWMGFPTGAYETAGVSDDDVFDAWSAVANTISEHESVHMLCHPDQLSIARKKVSSAVTVHVLQGERDMAQHNKSLGRFDLSDIPSAPRGMPQIEVRFDIDSNGILHVSAKDKATGKENKIKITAGSGLSDDEIERMVRDAEEHAEDDKKARELVDARNQGEAMVHTVQKTLSEAGDKVDTSDKESIEKAITELQAVLTSEDVTDIQAKTNTLMEASHKLAEQMYQAESDNGPADTSTAGEGTPGGEDVVDAEFEEVKEKKDD